MKTILFNFLSKYIDVSDVEMQALMALDIFRSAKKGEVLLKEGEVSDMGYFVLKGCLRTYYWVDGEENTTAFYTELDVIQPLGAINGEPSPYFIACTEDTLYTVSNPSMEDEIFLKFPKFETLCRKLSEQHLVQKQLELDAFKTASPEKRYLDLLENRPDLLQRVPQHQIASYLGVKPQSLSRIRARLVKK